MTLEWTNDPPEDTMSDRIEDKLFAILNANADLAPIKAFYEGEPGPIPTKLHPFGVIFLELISDANSQGYGAATGVRHYRYDGYIEFNVLLKDSRTLLPATGTRLIKVASYKSAKFYAQAAIKSLMDWGGPNGALEEDPVISFDTRERTVEFIPEVVRNGMAARDKINVTNRSSFNFHIMTTRKQF